MPSITTLNSDLSQALNGENVTLSGILEDLDKSTDASPAFNSECTKVTLSDNNPHSLLSMRANGTYHVLVEPTISGQTTWVLLGVGAVNEAPSASGMSWSSSLGVYEFSPTTAGILNVQRYNLYDVVAFDVRGWRIN
jgi:hypothetical protein